MRKKTYNSLPESFHVDFPKYRYSLRKVLGAKIESVAQGRVDESPRKWKLGRYSEDVSGRADICRSVSRI